MYLLFRTLTAFVPLWLGLGMFPVFSQTQPLPNVNNEHAILKPDELVKNVTVKGLCSTTKGGMFQIAGAMIDQNSLSPKLQRKLTRLKGKMVAVSGDQYTHYCQPYEQCLSEGVMVFIQSVNRVKRIRTTAD